MNYLLLDMATVMVDFDMKRSFHSSCLSNFDWLSEQGEHSYGKMYEMNTVHTD